MKPLIRRFEVNSLQPSVPGFCLECTRQELKNTSEDKLKRQRMERKAVDEAWHKEWATREKILELNREHSDFLYEAEEYLDDELEVLDTMLEEEKRYYYECEEASVQAKKLKIVRKALKKNQRDFARMNGYPVGKYADYENGKVKDYCRTHFNVTQTAEIFDRFMKIVAGD